MTLLLLSILPAALVADRLFGEPPAKIHPVCLMAALALRLETRLRRGPNGVRLRLAGLVAVALVAGAAALAGGCCMLLLQNGAAPWVGWLATTLLVGVCLAPSCLKESALCVARALEQGDMASARAAVGHIVGRNTASLDQHGIARACVESVAENLVDAVLATLFWAGVGLFLWGCPGSAALVFLHRATNTLDALWGKKNEKYICFGMAAARLDDALNYIPARLALPCIVVAALWSSSLKAKNSLRIGWKYRHAHESPNSAWSEAAFAGAIGLQLGGPAVYGTLAVDHPWLGEGVREATPAHIRESVCLMWRTTIVFTALAVALLALAA